MPKEETLKYYNDLSAFSKSIIKAQTHNIVYKTLGVKWLIQTFCPVSAIVSADRNEARNPQHFIHATVRHKTEEEYRNFYLKIKEVDYGNIFKNFQKEK